MLRWIRAFMTSSAGNTRGLIEGRLDRRRRECLAGVFRGEYPRPH